MPDEDRRRHLYIVGQTGTGKSTLARQILAMEDIRAGKGLAIIDPHGELIENALGFVPKERLDDVIYFNPGDLARPMGINMLDYNFDRPEEKTFIVNEMINIFDKLYDLKTTGGPMFEQYMRNALLAHDGRHAERTGDPHRGAAHFFRPRVPQPQARAHQKSGRDRFLGKGSDESGRRSVAREHDALHHLEIHDVHLERLYAADRRPAEVGVQFPRSDGFGEDHCS